MVDQETKQKILDTFSDRLRTRRKEMEITQEELAEKVGVSTAIISEYENARKVPGLASAIQCATVLGVTLNDLCEIDATAQYQKGLEQKPILPLLAVLKRLQFQVHVVENEIRLTVPTGNDRPDYSSQEILKFFKEYELIQEFAEYHAPDDLRKGIIEKLLKTLIEDYKDLPELPVYQFPKG